MDLNSIMDVYLKLCQLVVVLEDGLWAAEQIYFPSQRVGDISKDIYSKGSFFARRNIALIIILMALDNAPYKMLHKLKSACFIRKNQL